MQQKLKSFVITLVSPSKKLYEKYDIEIKNIFKKYSIYDYKFLKLSTFVKDYYFQCNTYNYKHLNLSVNHISKNVDIFVQEKKYRRKKIIACDMDMTVINVESINLINQIFPNERSSLPSCT